MQDSAAKVMGYLNKLHERCKNQASSLAILTVQCEEARWPCVCVPFIYAATHQTDLSYALIYQHQLNLMGRSKKQICF